ncbi:hypothetical protein MPTK1_6g12720 [Marchantia polymorpha subsp. ruderalis]|uniref:Peptidase M41 domain-containing protein n=2 Tax=Marchantia polymorpha TaxID=3197 RepID=A0AAF6BRD6_MARPO|nr:hypothetical protein MARPO_0059s0075 [Marchantia polymorpha]BBN14570.1 hypothetical protein Mp_6g12720 [Marchantia polymorpha subsp. ruderalis]|eukprot:PTQ37148.1 hypothetical protein MARPO_0059s0075 [Marchantia polymorpha]
MAQGSLIVCNAGTISRPVSRANGFVGLFEGGGRFAAGCKELRLCAGKEGLKRTRFSARASMEEFLKVDGTKKIGVDSKVWLNLIDAELQRGNEKQALELAKQLRAFGAAQLVPQRAYTLEELRLNKIEAEKFLSPVDSTLGSIRGNLQVAAVLLGVTTWRVLDLNQYQLLSAVVLFVFLGTVDQIANGGGVEALLLDTIGRLLSEKYRDRVAKHEAGHFLVAYLMGFMPKSYTLSSLDAFQRFGALNVQAGTTFIDFEFQEEVQGGKVSSGTLDKVSCIALAGVATEYILYGVAEGGLSDINQLDELMKILGFTQRKADSQVRWAVLNTVSILRRHLNLHSKLANFMSAGKSVLECVGLIEEELADSSNI